MLVSQFIDASDVTHEDIEAVKEKWAHNIYAKRMTDWANATLAARNIKIKDATVAQFASALKEAKALDHGQYMKNDWEDAEALICVFLQETIANAKKITESQKDLKTKTTELNGLKILVRRQSEAQNKPVSMVLKHDLAA